MLSIKIEKFLSFALLEKVLADATLSVNWEFHIGVHYWLAILSASLARELLVD